MGKIGFAGGKVGMEEPAPASYIALSTIAEGSLVKLTENGMPVEFYIAKHNYESGLNGAGRTLLVRKECYDNRVWNTSQVAQFPSSSICSWLNSEYKALHNEQVQSLMGATKFYGTVGNGDHSVTTFSKAVFLLSGTELGASSTYMNAEGSQLPTYATLMVATMNGSAVIQWTRSTSTYFSDYYAYYMNETGGTANHDVSAFSHGSRPCFTLPETVLFNEKTLLFEGVA